MDRQDIAREQIESACDGPRPLRVSEVGAQRITTMPSWGAACCAPTGILLRVGINGSGLGPSYSKPAGPKRGPALQVLRLGIVPSFCGPATAGQTRLLPRRSRA